MGSAIGEDQIARLRSQFEENGYAVLPSVFDRATCLAVEAELGRLLDEERVRRRRRAGAEEDPARASVFSTGAEQTHTTDEYFLGSGDKVRYFFEKDAGGSAEVRSDTVNKIGHALHADGEAGSAVLRELCARPVVAQLLRGVCGLAAPTVVQSMLILKPPRIGGRVDVHQDSSFIATAPESCTGFWTPLEDATVENGCLFAKPGSHRGPLRTRFRRDGMRVFFDPPLASMDPSEADGAQLEGFVPLEVPAGSVVLIHGRVLHYSHPNRSERSRHVFTFHAVDGHAHWLADNWMPVPVRRTL